MILDVNLIMIIFLNKMRIMIMIRFLIRIRMMIMICIRILIITSILIINFVFIIRIIIIIDIVNVRQGPDDRRPRGRCRRQVAPVFHANYLYLFFLYK